jgi:hypothetical protein
VKPLINGRVGSAAVLDIGTICAPTRCVGVELQRAATCDGMGTCVVSPVSCSPYVCRDDAPLCHAGCLDDSVCAGGSYCTDGEVCVPRVPGGAPCASDHECLSGSCVAGADSVTLCAPI